MSETDYKLTELRRSYQILGAPLSASAQSIKRSYRHLVKKWHPDLFAEGTVAHVESTRMTVLVNEAYSRIRNAPLRHYSESGRPWQSTNLAASHSSADGSPPTNNPAFSLNDRFGFWVRFACGALLGAILSIRLLVELYRHPVFLALSVVVAVLGCAFAAALGGDRFWNSIKPWWS
jgi:curved DNA-binding protein CbpA